MRIIAIRPKKRRRRRKAKAALYTVAFGKGELRLHDSAFDGFCKTDCGYSHNCNEECNADGEYGRLLYIWRQQGYLIRYFSNWRQKLNTDRYGHISVLDAIKRHQTLLSAVENCLLHDNLANVFEPLYKNTDGNVYFPKSKFKLKVKHSEYENWLRIYAVKYTDEETGVENYIITGGGIKLVAKMSDNATIEYEEKKQEAVIDFLIEKEITTRDKIETLIL